MNNKEISHFVRNDGVSPSGGGRKSGGEAATFPPIDDNQWLSFRPQGEISFLISNVIRTYAIFQLVLARNDGALESFRPTGEISYSTLVIRLLSNTTYAISIWWVLEMTDYWAWIRRAKREASLPHRTVISTNLFGEISEILILWMLCRSIPINSSMITTTQIFKYTSVPS